MRPRAHLVVPTLAVVIGCAPAPTPERPPTSARADKASLYGDASLLPTRAGERARHELALAGEIAAGLEHLALRPLQIDVRLDQGPSVVVIASASLDGEGEAPAARADVIELCRALVPGLADEDVHLWLRPTLDATPAPPPRDAPPWALALACLGLGLSLGVTLERSRGHFERSRPT